MGTISNNMESETEFSGRGVTCAPGQEFSAFGFISFLLIGINLSANIINNLNANSNDNNNNNNNNNENTNGRRLNFQSTDNYLEDQLIKDLIDESKQYQNLHFKNSFDKSIKMASMMTQKYVRTVKKWDDNFCNSVMCKLIE